jgi:tetratricopeptide (TPR) repeat protein
VYEPQLKGGSGSTGQTSEPTDPLRDTHRQLEQAEQLRLQGKLDRARAICEQLVGRYPDYFGALHTLGLICADQNQFPQALGYLVRAAMLRPRSWRTLTALSGVYLALDAREMAAHTLERASLIRPEDPSILVTLGEIYRDEREYELARDAYAKAFALDPRLETAALGLSNCCAHLGQYAETAKILESLIKSGSRSLSALSEFNQLPSAFVTIDVLSELSKIKPDWKGDKAEFENSLAFIRAAALHDLGRHTEAWDHLVSANRTMHVASHLEARQLKETEQANLAQLIEKRVKALGDSGADTRTISLFILGPSRSGKTSMEALVATLDGVKRGYENPSVENAIRGAFQSAGLLTSLMFEILPPAFDALCRDIYLDEELGRRAGPAKVFTNTHPSRIHDAARIAAAFPRVRFIFVKRNLEDNLLRIYMRKYTRGNSYAYDLKSARDHITWYHQMIDALTEKFPDIVRVVQYEEMVADPAATLRVAAELCGLPMTDKPLPEIGDDRGCAAPYRGLMAAVLAD